MPRSNIDARILNDLIASSAASLKRGSYMPCMRHGQPKLLQPSVRRPGKWTANHFPSCTAKEAKQFDAYWVPLPEWVVPNA